MHQERTCTEYESQPNNRDLGCARCHLLQYLGLPVRQPRYKPSTLIAYPYCPPTRPKARINKLLHPKVNLQVREQFVWSFAKETESVVFLRTNPSASDHASWRHCFPPSVWFQHLVPTRLNPCALHEGERPFTVPWVELTLQGWVIGPNLQRNSRVISDIQNNTAIRNRKYTPKVGLPCPELSTYRGTHQIVTWFRVLQHTGAPVSTMDSTSADIPVPLPRSIAPVASPLQSQRLAPYRSVLHGGLANPDRPTTPSSVNHTTAWSGHSISALLCTPLT